MYVYIQSSKYGAGWTTYGDQGFIWTVGFYDPKGKWNPESEHDSKESAARRVAFLNGANVSFIE